MTRASNALFEKVSGIVGRLRFPQLFLLTAALFLIDVAIPDLIPFVDEILLGLATLLLGSWTDRRQKRNESGDETRRPDDERGPVIDVTPDSR